MPAGGLGICFGIFTYAAFIVSSFDALILTEHSGYFSICFRKGVAFGNNFTIKEIYFKVFKEDLTEE
jgi:hypothetical protein